MTANIKVGGVWKPVTPHIKVSGVWKVPKSMWNKVTGEWQSSFLQGGVNDEGFTRYDYASRANNTVSAIAIQSDGKIIVGGLFATFNGVTVNRIVRLNSDGTRDTAFTTNTGTGANSTVSAIAVQSDGKILLGGNFTTFNGATVTRIVRLNSDGTRDTVFTTNTGTGASGNVNAVAVQSDGKIIVGGQITTFNGVAVGRVVRINADGSFPSPSSIDGAVGAASDNVIYETAIQPDGKVIFVGTFSRWNNVIVNGIVRLNSDGTLDTAFSTNTGTGTGGVNPPNVVGVQPDGKIVLGGATQTWNGVTVKFIVRLNSDGTRDSVFTTNTGTGPNNQILSIAVQPDGKIIVGGPFVNWNGVSVGRIVRLNSDGTLDTAFTTNTGTGFGDSINNFANSVQSITIQSDGKILVGSSVTTFNGVTVGRIVRLNSDGTRDTAFTTKTGTGANSTVTDIVVQSDGKIILGGNFTTFNGVNVYRIVRLNSDGTLDTAFTTNTGTGPNIDLKAIAIQSDGKILLGGNFTTFNGVNVYRIVRLNSDGTLDTAFTTNTGTGATGANSTVNAVAVQSDGKIIVVGDFLGFNGFNRSYIARIGGDVSV